jgi:hypothetical protein
MMMTMIIIIIIVFFIADFKMCEDWERPRKIKTAFYPTDETSSPFWTIALDESSSKKT